MRLDPKEELYRITFDALRLNRAPMKSRRALQDLAQLGTESSQAPFGVARAAGRREGPPGFRPGLRARGELAADPQAAFAGSPQPAGHPSGGEDHRVRLFLRPRSAPEFTSCSPRCRTKLRATRRVFRADELDERHDLALAVSSGWKESFSPETRRAAARRRGRRRCVCEDRDWAQLQAKLEKASWQQSTFCRLAYLSRAQERLGETAGGAPPGPKPSPPPRPVPALSSGSPGPPSAGIGRPGWTISAQAWRRKKTARAGCSTGSGPRACKRETPPSSSRLRS